MILERILDLINGYDSKDDPKWIEMDSRTYSILISELKDSYVDRTSLLSEISSGEIFGIRLIINESKDSYLEIR